MAARQLLPIPLSSPNSQPDSTSANRFRLLARGSMSTYGKRSNVTSACEACRQKKSKCDGNQPCATCTILRKECIFLRKDGRRQHERGEPLRALQAEVEDLQLTLEVLKFGSDDEALQALKELRSGTPDDSSPTASDVAPPDISQSSPDVSRNKSHKRAAKRQWDDRGLPLQDLTDIPPTFTVSRPPPQSTIKRGAQLFFDIVSGLLHVVDESDFDATCQRVYRRRTNTTVSDLAEMCAIAAVGSQFDPDAVTTDLRDALFRTVVLHLNDLLDGDSISALRCLACASIYGTIEKKQSIRALIHLGLQVARWSSNQYEESTGEYMELSKLSKTMILLECWLSTTLGYQPELQTDELRLIQESTIRPENDLNETSRAKVGELGVLRVRILEQVCSVHPSSATIIEQLTTDMETWYQSLPASMALTALFQRKVDAHSFKPQGAPILAHTKYLGAVILLHRRVLVSVAEAILDKEQVLASIGLGHAQRPHYLCVEAARSSARIFALLDSTAESLKLYSRCWLFMFEVLTVATVLLYDVALKMLMNLHRDAVLLEDLERIKACLIISEPSVATDPVAQQREAVLSSTYNHLRDLHTSLTYASTSASGATFSPPPRYPIQSSSRLQDTRQDVVDPRLYDVTHAIQALVAILKDPFGRGQVAGLNILTQEPGTDALGQAT